MSQATRKESFHILPQLGSRGGRGAEGGVSMILRAYSSDWDFLTFPPICGQRFDQQFWEKKWTKLLRWAHNEFFDVFLDNLKLF